jgi:hypothetical protein
MRFALIVSLSLAKACLAVAAVAAPLDTDTCPYLPDFKQLRGTLTDLPPAAAATALEHYAATHDNPEGCELSKIDDLLSEQELRLFTLHGDHESVAQLVYRCDSIDSKTARCTGPTEDLTAHPFGGGVTPLQTPVSRQIQLTSRKPQARLTAVYLVRLSGALDGRRAEKLRTEGSTIALPASVKNSALIAIFKTGGLWRYRKVVWYFGHPEGNQDAVIPAAVLH